MTCPNCGLEMIIYQTGEDGAEGYVCRNPRCPNYDKRLSPTVNDEEPKQ